MSLNDTPSGERIHIGFFGMRNAGKSSVVNGVTGQDLAVVSDVKGTTTDPVYKAMELLPMGPVVVIDTPGYDDEGALGELRVKKMREALNRCDCAVLVIDSAVGRTAADAELEALIKSKGIPYLVIFNKSDLTEQRSEDGFSVSAFSKDDMNALKERIARLVKADEQQKRIVGDLIRPGDLAVLVVPVDSAAPKGRLILPQQQTIRDILDADAQALVVKENGLAESLNSLSKKPAVVITDSQVFGAVDRIVPAEIPLTSFSILMARYKGFLDAAVQGVLALSSIRDGDGILICEGCTHHRQCEDIGTVKLPRWIREYTGCEPDFSYTSGREFPTDLSRYKLVIHCGGCMLNEREMRYRMKTALDAGVPFTNYGIVIAHLHGILKRSLGLFPSLADQL